MMLGTSREIENYKIYPIAQNRDYFLNLFSIKYKWLVYNIELFGIYSIFKSDRN